jgi:RND family efflux transporter MFP subunit
MRHRSIILGIAAIAAAGILFNRLSRDPETPAPVGEDPALSKPVAVETAAAKESRSARKTLSYPAKVTGDQDTVVTAVASGTASQVLFRLGDKVAPGQLLVRIDDPAGSLAPEEGFRSAAVRQAQLDAERAKKNYQEAKRIYEKDKTRANEAAKKIAKINYESAQAALTDAYDAHLVKSPVGGVVTAANIAAGESVSANQAVATVSRPGNTTLELFVSQDDLAVVTVGKAVSIAAGNGRVVPGTVARIAPQADPATGRFLVEAEAKEGQAAGSLVPGTIATVSFETDRLASGRGNLLLPLSAVLVGQNESAVFTVDNGRARRTVVQIVRIDGGMAEISAPELQEDTEIVVSGAQQLEDGQEVTEA